MAVREILLLGDPILRTKCRKVADFSAPKVKDTLDDLRDTLEHFRSSHGFGRGIAAPQIGSTQRIIVINRAAPIAMMNPVITQRSYETMTLWDDCFSFPDIMVKLVRWMKIHVRYRNESGEKQELEAAGDLSELLQHEIDHLNGVLALDRAIDSKHIILRSEWKKLTQQHGQPF